MSIKAMNVLLVNRDDILNEVNEIESLVYQKKTSQFN
jgi:hypothetical protein